MEMSFPSYLNKNKEVVENNGDATLPEGTQITWKFYTKNTNQIDFLLQDKEEKLTPEKEVFTFSHSARESFHYATVTKNQYFVSPDTLSHSIQVIKDLYPEINVQSQADSLFADRMYFKGNIRDDYGFSSLKFVCSVFDDRNNLIEQNKAIDIPFDRNATIQDFYFNFDAGSLNMSPGYSMEYFFEVKDNDGVNGAKAAKTHATIFRLKTMEEINKEIAQSNENTKSSMDDLAKEAANLAKELEKLNQQLLQVNEPSWQDKMKMEALMEQFKELQDKIQDAKDAQDRNMMKEEQYKNPASDIIKKQEELQKRFDNLLSDEMKQMIEKMQNMMMEMNKDQMREALEKMKMSAEDINKSLDQQLSLFKMLEFEKKFQDVIDNMRNLSQEQKDLSQQTDKKAIPKEELQQQQEQLNQKFEDLQQDIKELHQLNKELEEPNKLQNRSDQEKQIMQKMKESAEQLNKNNRSKAKDSQEDAAQQMEDMANALQMEKDEAEEEDLAEDIEALRQILENLLRVSFKQEDAMQLVKKSGAKSPLLTDYIREQSNIQSYMRMIDDSLTQLAKRQPMVEPFITKEVTKIREYSKLAQDQLVDRKIQEALSNQQFALTSMNNLALMLAESLKKMKDKMSSSSCCKGKSSKCGSCSKPGGKGKGKPKSARELQQQLNRQMEAMKRSMEQGNKPEGKAGQGQQGMSEQFARMAAQQEAIRKMMQDFNDELKGKDGVGDKSVEQLLEEMKKTEKELVNRSISAQTIARQKSIETRMLESERAHQEREKEEKRESTEARERYSPSPPKEWQFDKNKSQQTELLKTVPPALQYYYKEKVNRYFYNIGE
jgi:DNA repair exonuclease SbcCD ATPase subunit